ncbi:Rieske 2Fe-2S domain-containing protein [Burkholderia sp. Ax-1719]|nr:Rieske 2Fe-2S domain-containing protein [Burkholderia sp. Ax-1719]
MAEWIKALNIVALPVQSLRRVEIEGPPILLVNRDGDIHALSADCLHAGAPLEQGALCGHRIVYPWHKAAFDIDDGRWLEPQPSMVFRPSPFVPTTEPC